MIGIFSRAVRAVCLPLLFCNALVAGARADTVELVGKPPFEGVEVVGFRAGRLHFRGQSGETLRKPLGQVARIEIERLPDLGAAETCKDPATALARYEIAALQADRPWLRVLVRARMIAARDRGGDFEGAIRDYVALVRDGVLTDGAAAPRHPAAVGSAINDRARNLLQSAADRLDSQDAQTVLFRLTLELFLFDELELPPDFGPMQAATTSQPASRPATSAPSGPGGPKRLFGGGGAPVNAIHPVRLSSDSLVVAEARAALTGGHAARAVRLLEPAVPFFDAATRWEIRLLLARARLEAGELARAAGDLLALTAADAPAAVAAPAFYSLALAEERMQRPDLARQHYAAAGAHAAADAQLTADAQAALRRLDQKTPQSTGAPAPNP